MDQAITAKADARRESMLRLTLEEKLLLAAALYFIALKTLFTFGAFPIADEAYYWLWGRHLSFAYFDHPPLQGWLEGAAHAVFGRNYFALRFFSIVALCSNLAILLLVARRIGEDRWRIVFFRSTVVYLASPVFGWFGSVVFVDYLLVALMLGSGFFFLCYFTDVETRGGGRLRNLFVAALLLGLAGLTKFNAAYLGLAIVATVLLRPGLRPLLRHWPIYAAGILTLAMLSPVLVWNLLHDFASFRFHMSSRFDGNFTQINVGGMKAVAIDTVSMLGPFLVPAIVSFFLRRQANPFERVGKTIAIWVFWLSSATFLYIANFAWVMWWWNCAAFVLILPFIGRYIGPVMVGLHAVWGAVIATALTVSLTILPVTLLFGQAPFMETQAGYGWEEISAAISQAQREHPDAFLATNRYQTSSQLAFALDDPSVAAISPRRDAFDDWFDAAAHAGRSAIMLIDGREDTTSWRAHFDHAELLREIVVERFGYVLARYELYLASGFAPVPRQ